MSVNSKMSQIAGQLRVLTQDNILMGLDEMGQHLGESCADMFNAYRKIQNKGGTVPDVQSMGNLPWAVDTIPTGVQLNFQVVGGTAAPANPGENTVWVNTGQAITGYCFSPDQPQDLAQGNVWFLTGTESEVAFNALQSHCIQVCPVSAWQYVDGSLHAVTAKTYQSGQWKDWYVWDKGLYAIGDQYEPITGGWISVAEGTDCDMIFNASGLTLEANSYNGITASTRNKIDLTDCSAIHVSVEDTSGGSGSSTYNCFLRLHDSNQVMDIDVYVSSVQIPQGTSNKVFSLPVPTGGGKYHVSLVLYGVDNISVTVDRIWLE